MTLAEHNKRCEIIREMKAQIPDCGEARIEPGMVPYFYNGHLTFRHCFWLYTDNPLISQSFWTLDELERYVHRKIHALKLLTIVTPTPEERHRKDCLRRMCGFYEEKEMN